MGSSSDNYSLLLDNTPSIQITSPQEAVVSGPIEVAGTAVFKPTLNTQKGAIDLYVNSRWTGMRKKCMTEECTFSFQEIAGHLYDMGHGGPYTVELVASGGGAKANDSKTFKVDNTPSIQITSPQEAVVSGPIEVAGTAVFKPTLNAQKGAIDLYVNSRWTGMRKKCMTEECTFSFQEIAGHLYDMGHGGPYTVELVASGGGAKASDSKTFKVDNTPSIYITSPEGIVSPPFDIAGSAVFKPTNSNVKGTISVYINNRYTGISKSCPTENCTLSYKDMRGYLYSPSPGGPYTIQFWATGGGARAKDEKTFKVVPCNLKAVDLMVDSDIFDRATGGMVNFSGSLVDDSNRTIQWKVNVGGQSLSGEGTSVLAAWDGKDSSGKLVEPDTYVATLTAQTAEGTCSAKETKSVPVTIESQPEDPCLLACFGSTVHLASGNLRHSQTLFPLPRSKLGGDFVLTYNSLDGQGSPLGTGWTHTYNVRLNENSNGSYTLVEGDGRRVALYSRGDRYTPKSSNYPALTVLEDDTATLEHKEGIFYSFDSVGKVTAISDRNSNKVTLVYTDGNLPTPTAT
ncbi:MAG: hypothetical protein AMJ94_08625 [Deltaproteobacteria bacterium SM23_61]|nr:MAG: hypothetical protein AMJ94_08625 [Deltaproteobacteria bacterium SM23_61]